MNIKDYFERICDKGSQDKIDLETLTEGFQHPIHAVPFENLCLHCGETIQLDLESVYDKIVKHNRENNQLLFWAFQIMGYKVDLLNAHVYDPERKAYYPNFTHLLIRVIPEGKTYFVDGGLGVDYQMWQPMELISEKNQPQTPGIFCFTEKDGVWHLHKVKREKFRMDSENKILCSDIVKNMTCKNIYLFTLQPKTIDDTQLTLMVKTGFEPIVFCFLAWCLLQILDQTGTTVKINMVETFLAAGRKSLHFYVY